MIGLAMVGVAKLQISQLSGEINFSLGFIDARRVWVFLVRDKFVGYQFAGGESTR